MSTSASYQKCHCGADCYCLSDNPAQPCWGEVTPWGISGDDDFCHACQGHLALLWDGEYEREESDVINSETIAILAAWKEEDTAKANK